MSTYNDQNNPEFRALEAFINALGFDINEVEAVSATDRDIAVRHRSVNSGKAGGHGRYTHTQAMTETRIPFRYDTDDKNGVPA